MKFYFVRHGTTMINQEGRFNGGSVDSPLTTKGITEAIDLGKFLKDTKFDACFSSPQKRAIATAEIILSENNIRLPEIQIDDRLREINLGMWDGTIIKDHEPTEAFHNYFYHPDKFDASYNQGESFTDLVNRAQSIITDISQKSNQNDKVLITSHGVLLTVLMNILIGVPLSESRNSGTVSNSSVTILETDKGGHEFKTVLWNCKPKLENQS